MAIPCNIAFEDPQTKQVSVIYSHHNGYIDHTGRILFKYYNSEERARTLISFGHISVIAPEIGVQHDFDDCNIKACKFYGRDRGMVNQSARVYSTLKEALVKMNQDYRYVWTNGVWTVGGTYLLSYILGDLSI